MVQWERVSVPFANFTSHKEAFNAIGYLRARVLGARLLRSPGFKKDQVSVQTFDWTDLNTVSPSVLARTLKSLPVGQVSPILKDRQGYHLVRVLQRQYRHVSPDGKTTQPPATAEPAVPGPILQTGGVGNALPAKNAPRRSPKEQWPPDLGTLQLQPQPQPQPQPPRSFPVVNENEDRPPLPEPVPERVAPIAQPSAKQPETKQAAPSATQQPAPTIIDTRSDEPSPAGASPFAPLKRRGFGERKTTNSDSAADFSSGTSTPPAKPDWRDFGGIEPFPADSKTPAETARRRPMPNEAAAQPADGDIFGEEMNPRRQAVAPAKNNMKTDTKSDTPPPAAGRYRLPKKQQPTQELTPVWVPGMENQTSRDSGPSRRRIQPRRDDVPRRRPARTPPSRAVEWDAPSHPTPTGGTARFEATRSPVEARQQNVPVVRPTSRAATPANVTAGPPWSSIDRRAATRVPESPQPARIAPQQFVEPAEPARLPAKTIPARTVPEKAQPAQSESPRPRRRGNVYIQSGRRSPVREISVGDRTSTVRTPNALVPKLELGNERQAKPKSTPQRPVAKLRRQRPARSTLPNAAQNRNRTADSIRFVPVDSLRKRNRKSGETAGASERTSARHGRSTPAILDGGVAGAPSRPATVERKSPSDPSRKQKPLYFSRSGQRSMDYESELDSERE
jgi:hypothetical protein